MFGIYRPYWLGMKAVVENEDYYVQSAKIDADFIIIDESSMVDQKLANAFFSSVNKKAKILIVGDIDQLPSVGAGNVLRELINCELIPVTVLGTIYRQSNDSYISSNAIQINKGNTKLSYGKDFVFYEEENGEKVLESVTEIFLEELRNNDLDSVQVLTPSRDKGVVCSKTINEKIRELINPKSTGKPEITYGQNIFRLGDKVMQIKNKEVSNGEIGIITDIKKLDGKVTLVVEFSDKRFVTYKKDDLNLIQHAYSMTIHKSQGSEYKVVIVPILMSNYIMLKRNLLYTAITRGKEKVIIIGEKKALNRAINTNDISERNTYLGERIKTEYAEIIKAESVKKNENRKMKQLSL